MFVEAYIIITTGQIKTIWHSMQPECFEPGGTMQCPDQIKCCGLFENTPDTCGAGHMCQEDGTYLDKYLCNETVIGVTSYAEFAGIMLGMQIYFTLDPATFHNSKLALTPDPFSSRYDHIW